jgi:hypothetical protein
MFFSARERREAAMFAGTRTSAWIIRPKAHVTIHEDNWCWGPEDHYAFREHEGRGYWSGGVWTEF